MSAAAGTPSRLIWADGSASAVPGSGETERGVPAIAADAFRVAGVQRGEDPERVDARCALAEAVLVRVDDPLLGSAIAPVTSASAAATISTPTVIRTRRRLATGRAEGPQAKLCWGGRVHRRGVSDRGRGGCRSPAIQTPVHLRPSRPGPRRFGQRHARCPSGFVEPHGSGGGGLLPAPRRARGDATGRLAARRVRVPLARTRFAPPRVVRHRLPQAGYRWCDAADHASRPRPCPAAAGP